MLTPRKNGLLKEGVVVGQTWDGPPLALKNAGEPVMYQAPKEGSMAWVDGMAIPVGASNIDQIYAFVDFAYRAEPAGKAINSHGYNSPVLGADKYHQRPVQEELRRSLSGRQPGQPQSLAGRSTLVC